MPKMKTHSGAKKRFKVTGSGKVKRKAAGKNHFLRRKSKSAKRRLNRDSFVDKTNIGAVRRYLNI